MRLRWRRTTWTTPPAIDSAVYPYPSRSENDTLLLIHSSMPVCFFVATWSRQGGDCVRFAFLAFVNSSIPRVDCYGGKHIGYIPQLIGQVPKVCPKCERFSKKFICFWGYYEDCCSLISPKLIDLSFSRQVCAVWFGYLLFPSLRRYEPQFYLWKEIFQVFVSVYCELFVVKFGSLNEWSFKGFTSLLYIFEVKDNFMGDI